MMWRTRSNICSRSVLTRRYNETGDIVRVGRGVWGLKEWYPGRNFNKKDASKNDEGEAEKPEEEAKTAA